jgi:hypothetical protein
LRAQGIVVLDRALAPASEDGRALMGADTEIEKTLIDPGASEARKIEAIASRYLAAADGAFAHFDCHTVVTSAENLARLAPDRAIVIAALARLMPRYDLRILFYVRRPDYWLESAWKQWTMKVTSLSPAEWAMSLAKQGLPDFLGTARDWRAMAGPDRFVIRLLDPQILWGDAVLQDFAGLIGAAALDFDIVHANPMLHPALLRFFQRHRGLLFSHAHDTRLFDWAERLRLFAPSGQRLLSEPVRQRLLAALSDQNRALLSEFFPDVAPALLPSWCPKAPDEPLRDLDPPPRQVPPVVAGLEGAVARAIALALKLKRR